MKKITGIVMILVLAISVSGCTITNNSNMQNNSNITVKINSDRSWNGTLIYNNKTQVINGNGSVTYNLGQNPGSN